MSDYSNRQLHPSPAAMPRRSPRNNKGKAPQYLEDYVTTLELRQNQEKAVRTKKRSKACAEQAGQLLPGIPDDNTLTDIAPKLSWRDIYTLASVSPAWQQAVESKEVHNERVRTHSTETLAVIGQFRADQGIHVLTLFSIRDKYELDLPPIPFYGGIPGASRHVLLDGRLYVLGGLIKLPYEYDLPSKEAYVLDLAGKWEWKRCARMRHPRIRFNVATLDGRIHVYGGFSLANLPASREVYDPKVDAWFPLPLSGNHEVYRRISQVQGNQSSNKFVSL